MAARRAFISRIADDLSALPAEADAAKPAPVKEEPSGAPNSKQTPQATAEG